MTNGTSLANFYVGSIPQCHDGKDIENSKASQSFEVSNGIKQEHVLAHTLFNLLFSTMLPTALSRTNAGIKIQY